MKANPTPWNPEYPHRGYLYHRVEWDALERAFAQDWESANIVRPCLQEILDPALGHVTRRDRYVAATVIQWLGTNVGYAFLFQALHKGGYYLHTQNTPFGGLVGTQSTDDPLASRVEAEIAFAQAAVKCAQMTFDLSEPT